MKSRVYLPLYGYRTQSPSPGLGVIGFSLTELYLGSIWKVGLFIDDLPKKNKQDGSHEPECIHVLGLRVKTSAIGTRTFFFHTSCAHIVSAKAPHQQFTKRQLTHKETHNKNRWFCNSTTKSPVQRNHQHNEITSTTKSPAQQHHQHNEITSEQHQRNKITSTNEITSTTKSPAKRNHQHNNISSTTRSPPAAQQHHQHNNITSAMKS